MFKVEPLVGVGILDINPRLALTIADRLLGGRGHSVKAERYLCPTIASRMAADSQLSAYRLTGCELDFFLSFEFRRQEDQ